MRISYEKLDINNLAQVYSLWVENNIEIAKK